MTRSVPVRLAVAVAVAALAGCSGADTPGALLRLEGSVVNGGGNLPPMDVALLWQTEVDARGCDRASEGVARVGAVAAVPGSFQLAVTQPPPTAASFGDPPVAEAYLAAVDGSNRAYGWAANAGKVVYKVFYARRDIPAGSSDSARFGGTGLRAGYQLGSWDRSSGGPSSVLRIAPEGETVSIEIVSPSGTPIESTCRTGPAGDVPTPVTPPGS